MKSMATLTVCGNLGESMGRLISMSLTVLLQKIERH